MRERRDMHMQTVCMSVMEKYKCKTVVADSKRTRKNGNKKKRKEIRKNLSKLTKFKSIFGC